MSEQYDALVIGGGLAGVTAARELEFRGLRTLIIEARERLGGRMWMEECGGGLVEMGGQNVYWTRPFLWTEVKRYGLAIAEAPAHHTFAMATDDGIKRYRREEALKFLAEGFEKFFDGIGTTIVRPDDPLGDAERLPELERLDGMSVQDRLDELDLSPEAEMWLRPWLTVRCGGGMDRASLAWMIHRYASSGGSWKTMLTMAGRYQLAGGSRALIDAVFADSGAALRLGAPVKDISDDGELVQVETVDGTTFAAPIAVVATSANVWPDINFTSGISDVRLEAGREGMMTPYSLTKLWAVARGEVEELYVQNPDTTRNPIIHVRKEKSRENGTTMILGCSFDPNITTDKAELKRLFEEMLPMPDGEIIDVIGHNWVADPFARGGTSMLHVGQVTGAVSEVRKPEGRIAFATADISYGISAGMDGAIESGVHAAIQAAAIAGKRSGRTPSLAG
jgi:monoamine oxidase